MCNTYTVHCTVYTIGALCICYVCVEVSRSLLLCICIITTSSKSLIHKLLLTIITGGIYYYCWYYNTNRNII